MRHQADSPEEIQRQDVRRLISWLVMAASLGVAVTTGILWKTRRERAVWRESAITRLAGIAQTDDLVQSQLDELKEAMRTNRVDLRWAHSNVLLMANGEYLLFEYRHGRNDYFPPHLFVAHGSDGRWYSSDYHFCNSMGMVEFNPQPRSIDEFAGLYAARRMEVNVKGAR